LDRGIGGILEAPSAYFCKHPARQFTDDEAFTMIEDFINEDGVLSLKTLKRAS
jgi:myo-inositol-1-phosphate synthase